MNAHRMSLQKKGTKSKFISEDLNDFLNSSQLLNDSPIKKKQPKRQRVDSGVKDITVNSIGPIENKKKISGNFEVCGEARQKILNVMNCQLETRKQINNSMLKSFAEVIAQMEADYNSLKENEQKLEHLTGSFIKCVQQGTAAHKQKLKAFKEIHESFKQQCEETEGIHESEINKMSSELEEDMRKFKDKLIADTKRNGWETLKRSFIQAMQNDF